MILIINTSKEKLHYYEFVKPIEDILGEGFFTKHYSEIDSRDLGKADKIIICGTSLKDNEFVKHRSKFKWIKDFDKPILGICAGMQIIGVIFGGDIKNKTEIGFYKEKFENEFLGLFGEQEVYHLHNNHVSKWKGFDIFCSGNGIVQAVKHKGKEIYGCLFHPEVRQKDLIKTFVKLK
jgi:GMP synthase (glutamine-hydrolysing)